MRETPRGPKHSQPGDKPPGQDGVSTSPEALARYNTGSTPSWFIMSRPWATMCKIV